MGRASPGRFFERKEKGYKSYIKGMEFEKKVSNWLTDQGFRVKTRIRTKRLGEFDLIASKGKWLGLGEDVLLVECKDKSPISGEDINKFAYKVKRLHEAGKIQKALFVYRGELDTSAERALKIMNEELRGLIQIKKWPSKKR